jgi:urea transporter
VRRSWRSLATFGKVIGMKLAAEILGVLLLLVPFVVVGYFFIWAAKKDGEEDRALQRRLGIRRKTRLGR